MPVLDPSGELDVLKRVLDAAMKTASPSVLVQIVAERRRVIHEHVAVAGPTAPRAVQLSDIDGYFEIETAMFDALEPFPLAREAMAKVLREMLARRREEETHDD